MLKEIEYYVTVSDLSDNPKTAGEEERKKRKSDKITPTAHRSRQSDPHCHPLLPSHPRDTILLLGRPSRIPLCQKIPRLGHYRRLLPSHSRPRRRGTWLGGCPRCHRCHRCHRFGCHPIRCRRILHCAVLWELLGYVPLPSTIPSPHPCG